MEGIARRAAVFNAVIPVETRAGAIGSAVFKERAQIGAARFRAQLGKRLPRARAREAWRSETIIAVAGAAMRRGRTTTASMGRLGAAIAGLETRTCTNISIKDGAVRFILQDSVSIKIRKHNRVREWGTEGTSDKVRAGVKEVKLAVYVDLERLGGLVLLATQDG